MPWLYALLLVLALPYLARGWLPLTGTVVVLALVCSVLTVIATLEHVWSNQIRDSHGGLFVIPSA